MEHHWTSSNFNSRPLRKSHAAVKYLLYIWIFTFVTRKKYWSRNARIKAMLQWSSSGHRLCRRFRKNWVQSSEAFVSELPIDYPSASLNMAMEKKTTIDDFPIASLHLFHAMHFSTWLSCDFFMAFPHENHHENRGGDFQLPHQATARKYPTSKKAWIGFRLDWKRANRARFETTKSVHFVFVKRMCM